jgi:hypothetical protein
LLPDKKQSPVLKTCDLKRTRVADNIQDFSQGSYAPSTNFFGLKLLHETLNRLKERERKSFFGGEVVRDTTFKGGGGARNVIFICGVGGSQTVSARPSGRGSFERG